MINKLLIFILSLLAGGLEAATITNWVSQLPTAVPTGADVILMQKGGIVYYFTPNQLAVNLSTNVNMITGASSSNALYSIIIANDTTTSNGLFTTETTRNGAVSNALVSLIASSSGGATQPSTKTRFVFDGDSIFAGDQVSGKSLPYWLFNVYLTNNANAIFTTNNAVGGSQVGSLTSRYAAGVQPFKPAGGTNAIYVFFAGGNDIFSARPTPSIINDISNLTYLAHADGFAVAVLTLTKFYDWPDPYTNAIQQFDVNRYLRTRGSQDYLIDAAALVNQTNDLVDDDHFTTNTHRILAKELYDQLQYPTNRFRTISDDAEFRNLTVRDRTAIIGRNANSLTVSNDNASANLITLISAGQANDITLRSTSAPTADQWNFYLGASMAFNAYAPTLGNNVTIWSTNGLVTFPGSTSLGTAKAASLYFGGPLVTSGPLLTNNGISILDITIGGVVVEFVNTNYSGILNRGDGLYGFASGSLPSAFEFGLYRSSANVLGIGSNGTPYASLVVSNITAAGSVTVTGTTNQLIFGNTNPAPASAVAPTKWISVQVAGDATLYRLPLYQ